MASCAENELISLKLRKTDDAALLLPALAQAKEKGRQRYCVNSVRQQALAAFMYADNFQQLLPPVACTNAAGVEIDWLELLDPYLKQNGIHICLTDRDARMNSYGSNELACVDLTDPGSLPQTRLSVFRAPAQALMMGDPGTDNDLRTVRPDTLKMVAPGSDINDDKDTGPSHDIRRVGI